MATAVATTPSMDLTHETRDFATKRGTYIMKETPVEDYLRMLDLYDPRDRTSRWDDAIHASFQRAVLPIPKNAIKRRMFRDLARGSTLPPVVLYDRHDQRPLIVDGLQRTHVLSEALRALLAREREEKLEKFAREEFDSVEELKQKVLPVDEFLDRPVVYQLWQHLEHDELVRLFMVLNVGQQKVSPRHLLEVMGDELRQMFQSWGLPLLTERQEKEMPRRPRRAKDDEDITVPGYTHFRYEYLLDALYAYVTRDPHVKTSKILQETGDETPKLALDERIAEIGSEACREDFLWASMDLNNLIQQRYAADPSWRIAIQNRDHFFIPLMAALGDARHNEQARSALEDRKRRLIEIMKESDDPDPLALSRTTSDGLGMIQSEIRSNIGRRQRAVVFLAWRRYFRVGPEQADSPIDWRTASLSM
jgi:hypothetical protein